jgi:outer membrane receptor protein involved in Fe transport
VDLRGEWFPSVSDLWAVSLFYKRVIDPIELVIYNDNNATRFENVGRGMLIGVELEARVSLETLLPALKGFRLSSNLAFIHSQVSLGTFELNQKREWDADAPETRPLYGQSPYVLNADLTYDFEAAGITTGIFFNVFGPRLAAVSKKAAPDIYEQPAPTLNASFQKKLGRGLTLSLGLANLLDAEIRKIYTFKDQDYFQTRYRSGRTGSLAIGYSFK